MGERLQGVISNARTVHPSNARPSAHRLDFKTISGLNVLSDEPLSSWTNNGPSLDLSPAYTCIHIGGLAMAHIENTPVVRWAT